MSQFSVNAASEALERDRRTIVKALRHVAPDSFEGGGKKHPRWKLPTIIAALATLEAPKATKATGQSDGDAYDAQWRAANEAFDREFEKLKKLPTLAQRRAKALEVGDIINSGTAALLARDKADGLDPEHAELRAQRLFFLAVTGLCTPCGWSRDQAWSNVVGRAA